jgi:hypothetical protein
VAERRTESGGLPLPVRVLKRALDPQRKNASAASKRAKSLWRSSPCTTTNASSEVVPDIDPQRYRVLSVIATGPDLRRSLDVATHDQPTMRGGHGPLP